MVVAGGRPDGYNRGVATEFTQLDARIAALREAGKPALRYLAAQLVGAIGHLARAWLATRTPQWQIRERRDQPGYWWERTYTDAEVTQGLQQIWEALSSQRLPSPHVGR
jgi:hypothetical protein